MTEENNYFIYLKNDNIEYPKLGVEHANVEEFKAAIEKKHKFLGECHDIFGIGEILHPVIDEANSGGERLRLDSKVLNGAYEVSDLQDDRKGTVRKIWAMSLSSNFVVDFLAIGIGDNVFGRRDLVNRLRTFKSTRKGCRQ